MFNIHFKSNLCPHMVTEVPRMKDRMITLSDEHLEAIEEIKERPGGFNLSQYIRNKLEEDFPEKFE